MHLSHSGSRSDKRKARGRGLPPSSGVVLSNEARVRVRSFGFVQPCCSGTLWLSDAVCLRVHCATVPWEWLHKVLCASRVSIPRPSNLLSERDPLCRRGSRVNFMKLTLLPRRQSGSRSDKRLEGRGIETRDAQRTLWSHSHGTVAQCTRKHTASESHKVPLQHGWTKPKLRTRTRASLDRTTPEEGGSPRPRAFLLSERDPLCDKCIGAEAELTS